MADEQKPKQRLEIAHVLFIDIVDYSKLLTDEQSEALHELNQIVRNTETARDAQAAGQLIILPTGDGMALVFTASVEEPVECALEISHALRAQPSLPVRMGIHSGPVHHVKDANQRENIAGVGINIAQRVMDCGDAGHILISKRVADDLAQQRRWQPYLHELGDVEVKHGVVVSLVNLYAETIGNPTPPARIGKAHGALRSTTTATRTGLSPLARAIFILATSFIALAIVSVIFAPAIMRSLRKDQAISPPQPPAIPSPPSIGDVIKSEVAKKITDALQDARSPKNNAAVEPSAAVAASATAKSVAVLPLVNTSGDPTNEYFSDGLSEELIAVLAKLPELKVIGRSSSFLFKGNAGDSKSIGEKLGVAHLIEGSVRRQGERVRIVAELINAADGRELWSETYDRELKDVFAVQSEIASAVAEQMKVKLLGRTARSDAMPSNQNLAAHNAVLQADFYFQQQTAESVRRAITFLQEAVQLDPNYGFAYARLSQAWRQYGATYATEDADHAYAEARKAAEMATKLAPDLVESHKALGWVAMTPDLNFRTAEKEFRLALAAAPGDASAKNALSYALMAQGRLAEAEQVCHEAIALDPLLTALWYNLGRLNVGIGRYQEAEDALRKGLELQPHASRFHTYLAAIALLHNDPAEALRHAQLESEGFWRDYAMTVVQQAQPDRAAADAALKTFSEKYKTSASFQIAFLHAMRKEPEEVFKWLDTAYAVHDSGLTQLVITPFLSNYRSDPRFIALCQKLGVQLPAKP